MLQYSVLVFSGEQITLTDAFTLYTKQPKFDVIDRLRKVSTGSVKLFLNGRPILSK